MGLADDTIEARRQTNRQGLKPGGYQAVIRSTPDSEADPLRFVIPGRSREHRWETRRWRPHGSELPIEGDLALAIPDDRGDFWIVDWFPSEAI